MHRRPIRLVVLAALLVAVALLPASPAAAAEPLGGCWLLGGPTPNPTIDLDNDGDPEARLPHPGGSFCVWADTGLYDVARLTCSPGWYECVLRVTTGHEGSAAVEAAVCAESWPDVQPVCASVDSGTIPLIPVEPRTFCIGWSLGSPACYEHGDQ